MIVVADRMRDETGTVEGTSGYYIDVTEAPEESRRDVLNETLPKVIEARAENEQAKGALKLVYGINDEQAFNLLRWRSQENHTCGFIASAVARRNKRRVRGFFLPGFFCGFMAGTTLRKRRRGLNALGIVARCADVRQLTAGIRRSIGRFAARALTSAASHVGLGSWPPQSHRRMSQRPALGCGPSLGATRARMVNALTQRCAQIVP